MLVCADAAQSTAEIAPAIDHKVRIVLVGDSTVTDTTGWGLGFNEFVNDNVVGIRFKDSAIKVKNGKSLILQTNAQISVIAATQR